LPGLVVSVAGDRQSSNVHVRTFREMVPLDDVARNNDLTERR